VVTLAYNYNKPVIASAVGGLPDMVVDGETGWLISPKAPVELAKTIAKIDREQTKTMIPNIKNYCAENSWDNMANEICKFASKLTNSQRS
jgi:glycosyltransferase involved in cell wall biosynthesis